VFLLQQERLQQQLQAMNCEVDERVRGIENLVVGMQQRNRELVIAQVSSILCDCAIQLTLSPRGRTRTRGSTEDKAGARTINRHRLFGQLSSGAPTLVGE
jgi:hypothetical protein